MITNTTNFKKSDESSNMIIIENTKDPDSISLYDIKELIKTYSYNYNENIYMYQKSFNDILKNTYGIKDSLIIYGLDYKTKELNIGFKYISDDKYDKISLIKKDENLYISKSETCADSIVFQPLSNRLLILYNELLKFTNFNTQKSTNIKTNNSKFIVDISKYGINLYSIEKDLQLSPYNQQEQELLKNIFVKINDCPEWSKDYLFKKRIEQLEEEKKYQHKKLKKHLK